MTEPQTISVIIAAYNEGENLQATVNEVVPACEAEFDDYELIVIDDASRDDTPAVADRLGAANPRIRVIHNPTNRGLGWNFRHGLEQARMQFVTLVNGKHDIAADQLRRIFRARDRADVVVPYHTNRHERPLARRLVSRTFTTMLNLLFGYRMHYYNDSVLHRTERVRRLRLRTSSYAFTAEALIKSLRSGCTWVEVPIVNIYPKGIRTSAFRAKNVTGVGRWLMTMLWDVYVAKDGHDRT